MMLKNKFLKHSFREQSTKINNRELIKVFLKNFDYER